MGKKEKVSNQPSWLNIDLSSPTGDIGANIPVGIEDSGKKTTYGESKLDQPLPTSESILSGEYNYYRGQKQSNWDKAANGLLRATGKTVLRAGEGIINPFLGIGLAMANSDASKLWDNSITNSVVDLSKSLDDALPLYSTRAAEQAHGFEKFKFANTLWGDILDGASYSAAGMLSGNITTKLLSAMGKASVLGKAKEVFDKYVNIDNAADKIKYINNIDDVLKKQIKDGVKKGTYALISSTTEASDNALSDSKEFVQKLTNELTQGGQRELTDGEKQYIERLRKQVGNSSYALNLPVIMADNWLTFGKSILSGKTADKALMSEVAGDIEKGTDGLYKAAKKSQISKIIDKTYGLRQLSKPFVSEGTQEQLQLAITKGTNDFYTKKYYNPSAVDFLESLQKGLAEAYSTDEGWDNFLIGAVSGGLFGGATTIATEGAEAFKNPKEKQIADAISTLNSVKSKDAYKAAIETIMRHYNLTEEQAEAAKNNDDFEYHNKQSDLFLNYVLGRIKTGKIEDLKDDLENFKGLSKEEFESTYDTKLGENQLTGTKETVHEYIQKRLDKVNRVDKLYKSLENIIPNADPSIKDRLLYSAFSLEDSRERARILDEEISKIVSHNTIFNPTQNSYFNGVRYSQLTTKEAKDLFRENLKESTITPVDQQTIEEKIKDLDRLKDREDEFVQTYKILLNSDSQSTVKANDSKVETDINSIINEKPTVEKVADKIIEGQELDEDQINLLMAQDQEVEEAIKDKTIPKNDNDKMHVVLHGDTEENETGLSRNDNSKLNQDGLEEANKNKERIANEGGIDSIVSSPLERAQVTSDIITNGSGHKTHSGLATWDIGELKGKPEHLFDEKYWVEHPDEPVAGGESFNQFKHRVIDAFKDIANGSHGDTAIVTHSKVEALLKAWEAAGADGYNIDEKTYLNYKEDRSQPTTVSRGLLKGFLPVTETVINPDMQNMVSETMNKNIITSSLPKETVDIKSEGENIKYPHVAMMRMYDHKYKLVGDNRVFTWARTENGSVRVNPNSKVSKEVNKPTTFLPGSKVIFKLVELDPFTKEFTEEYIKESINLIKIHIRKGNTFGYSEANNYGFGNNEAIGIYDEAGNLAGFYPLPHAITANEDFNAYIKVRNEIISERESILNRLSEGEEVSTTVRDKGTGNLLMKLTPDLKHGDFKDAGGNWKTIFNEIDNREQDLVNGRPVFAFNNGDGLVVPDIGNPTIQSQIELDLIRHSNKGESGQVFRLVKSANGSWFPTEVYATPINDDVAQKILDTLLDFPKDTNALDLVQAVSPYIYANFEDGSALTIKNPHNKPSMLTIEGRNYTLQSLEIPANQEAFKEALKTKRQNIDIRNINTDRYQQLLRANKTLTTNVYTDGGEYLVQPYISLEPISEAKPAFKSIVKEDEEKVDISPKLDEQQLSNKEKLNKFFGEAKDEDFGAFKKGINTNTKVDRAKAKEWLAKYLPGLTLSDIDIFSKIKGLSSDTLGMYKNKVIYLFNGDNKVLYHEAFHGVFRSMLTSEERAELLKEGTEEELADKFAEYVDSYETRSLSKKLLDFFKDIFRMFNIFRTTKQSKLEDLWDRVKAGEFKEKSLLSKEDAKWTTTYKQIGQFSASTKKYHVDNITGMFVDLFKQELDKGLLVKEINTDLIFRSIFNKYNSLYTEIASDPTKYSRSTAMQVMGVVENWEAFEAESIKSLVENKIKTSKSSVKDDGAHLDEEDYGDNEDTSLNGNTTKGFGDMTSIPGLKSASTRLKLFLMGIEVLDENGLNKTDDFGFKQYYNFNQLYYFLERNLVDLNTFEDMLQELDRLSVFRPELKQVKNKLTDETVDKESLKRLQNDFKANFSKQQLVYTLVKFDNDPSTKAINFKVFDANRQSIGREVESTWASQLIDPTRETIAETKEGETIVHGTAKAKAMKKAWDTTVKGSTDFKTINDFLYKYGISFSPEVLEHILKSPQLNAFKANIGTLVDFYANEDAKENRTARKALQSLVELETTGIVVNYTSSFDNVENKPIYTVQLPSFASRVMAGLTNRDESKFKAKLAELTQDPTYKSLNILDELQNPSFRNTFKLNYLDGLKDDRGNQDGSKFTNMGPKDFMAMQLALYSNTNQNKQRKTSESVHKYVYLTPSDKTMSMIFDSKSYGVSIVNGKIDPKSEIVKKYYNIVRLEATRIKKALEDVEKLPKEKLLQHYHYLKTSDKLDGQAFRFNYLSELDSLIPELTELLKTDSVDEALAKINSKVIEKLLTLLNKEAEDVEKEALNKGLITKQDGLYNSTAMEIPVENKTLSDKDSYIRKTLASYALNDRLAKTELSHILNGDIAFYKPGDLAKRTYQSGSMTIALNTTEKPVIKAVAIDDLEVPTEKEFIDSIEAELKRQGVKNIDSIIGNYKKSNNVTDAQVWSTPEAYKAIHVARGTWTPEMQVAYDIAEGITKPEVIEDKYRNLLSAIKPFAYGLEHNSDLGLNVPNQLKCSIMPLFKSYTDLNPLLREHRAKLEANGIDFITTKSSLKAGLGIRDKFDNSTGGYNNVVNISMENFGVQVDNPDHLYESDNSSLRQLKMLLLGAIDPSLEYNGTKGSEIISELSNLEATNVRESLKKLLNDISGKNEDFKKRIAEQVTKRNATENTVTALETVDGKFRFPLDMGPTAQPVENLISSIFTNDVIKQSIKGGSAVQASAIGFKKNKDLTADETKLQSDLKWIKTEDGKITHVEAAMPAWAKEFFDESGQPKDNIPDELKQILVYRIPTEGFHSMLPVKVVKFLPPEMGNFILLPYEITTQFGADFDFDKIYFLAPEFTKEKNGELKKVGQGDTEASRNNRILDLYMQVLTSVNTLKYTVKPSGFEELADLKKKIEGKQPVRNFFSSRNQRDLKERNHIGIGLKGQSALHVSGHSYAAILGLNTQGEDRTNVFKFNFNEDNFSLSNLYNKKGELIADELSSMMAAILDDIKSPILETLGINANTIDVWATIVRAGEGTETAINLITQPAIRELSKKLQSNNSKIKDKEGRVFISNVIDTYQERYNRVYESLTQEQKDDLDKNESYGTPTKEYYNLTDKEMESWRNWARDNQTKVTEDSNHNFEYAKYLIFQLRVLNNYNRYDVIAKDLVKINRLFGVNKEVGPNVENVIDKVYLAKELMMGGVVKGLENINQLPQLQAYLDTHENALEAFRQHFPYMTSMYTQIKNEVARRLYKTSGVPMLSIPFEKRMKINNFIRMFTDNKFFFNELNDSKNKEKLLKEFPKQIMEIQDAKNDSKYFNGALRKSSLFQNIRVIEDRKKNPGIYYIGLTSGKMDLSLKNTITESFLSLYNNDKTRELAIDLLRHSYITTGLASGLNSYHNLIPVEMFEDMGYTNHRADVVKKLADDKTVLDDREIELLVDQLVRNFPGDFTKVFDAKVFIKSGDGLIVNQVELKNNKNLIVGKDENDEDIFVSYIRVFDKEAKAVKLYSYNKFEEAYQPVSKLGIKGKFIEINTLNGLNSIIKDNNVVSNDENEPIVEAIQSPTLESGSFSFGTDIDSSVDEDRLRAQDDEDGEALKPINIYAGTGENLDLSNFAKRPFKIGDDTFNTVEGAFQAAKIAHTESYIKTGKMTTENRIIFDKLKTATGAEAKSLGRKIKGLDVYEWDKVSSNRMLNLLRESFKQNPEALNKLLATGNTKLTHTQDKGKWGTEFPRLLMQVRDEFSKDLDDLAPNTPPCK